MQEWKETNTIVVVAVVLVVFGTNNFGAGGCGLCRQVSDHKSRRKIKLGLHYESTTGAAEFCDYGHRDEQCECVKIMGTYKI